MSIPGWVFVLGSLQVLIVAWMLRSWRSIQRRRYLELRVRHRAALVTIRRVIALTDDPSVENARALLDRVQMVLAPWRPRVVRGSIPAESRKASR